MKQKSFSEDKLINVGEPLPASAMEMVVGGVTCKTSGDTSATNNNTDSYDPSTHNEYGDVCTTTVTADK